MYIDLIFVKGQKAMLIHIIGGQGWKPPQFNRHTKDKYFGSWLWNLGQECNLQPAWRQSCWQVSWSSPMLPKMVSWSSPMLRRWREPEIFPPGATEDLAWLRERTFTGEKLLGTRSLPCSSVLRQNASLWSALLLKFHSHHCRVERGTKGPDRKFWRVLVFLPWFMKPAFTRI